MTNKEIAIKALQQIKGDDLVRAQRAFKIYTEEQMQEEHGRSGKTRAQIIQIYQDYENRIDKAIDWVITQP